jgi:hypothetical protein
MNETAIAALKNNIKAVFKAKFSMESCAKKYEELYHSL